MSHRGESGKRISEFGGKNEKVYQYCFFDKNIHFKRLLCSFYECKNFEYSKDETEN